MTLYKYYDAVARLYLTQANEHEEIASQSVVVHFSDVVDHLLPSGLVDRGQDCFWWGGDDMSIYFYYPKDSELSPEEYLAKSVARFASK